MAGLPPPPTGADPNSDVWQNWYFKLNTYLSVTGQVPWTVVGKDGANITDIPLRSHANLQTLQGGTTNEYYHLTAAQYNALAGLVSGGVASVLGYTGAVTLSQLVTGGVAPLASPAFTSAVGFNGSPAIAKQTVTGSRSDGSALASLLTVLASYGLITDSTTA